MRRMLNAHKTAMFLLLFSVPSRVMAATPDVMALAKSGWFNSSHPDKASQVWR